MINPNNTPFLFSIGTNIAYKIAKEYYENVQYVWCSPKFDSIDQPPTSNPLTIAKRYIEQIKTGDRHAKEIDSNKTGILIGAKEKHDAKIINDSQKGEIHTMVAIAKYEDFFPILFVIDSRRVIEKCIEIEKAKKVSDTSTEYLIPNLLPDEYELIDLKKLFDGLLNVADRKAGK